MKKSEKIETIRWYISQYCCLSSIQTEKDRIEDIKELEKMVMKDRGIHAYDCDTCWHNGKDYYKKCVECKDGSNYTFPYGYWNKMYLRSKV